MTPTKKMLLVGTGSIAVSSLPIWVSWARRSNPEVELKILLTRSATRFVSAEALRVLGGCEVIEDSWESLPKHYGAFHVEMAEWADSVLVYPATTNFVTKFAQCITDSPALLTVQCTEKPVVVAPSLPAGCAGNPYVTDLLSALDARKNVTVLPTVSGLSVGNGEDTPGAPSPFSAAWSVVVASLDGR
ncbi:flavoprotein [Streptomyces sp. NPDC003720]|uniref:flavoprotein n=1 Tax=Streptomyces sp. NPDC003720 TaxID=3364684 RepID=UPI0036C2B7ED